MFSLHIAHSHIKRDDAQRNKVKDKTCALLTFPGEGVQVCFPLLDDLGCDAQLPPWKRRELNVPIHGTDILSETKGVFNSPK